MKATDAKVKLDESCAFGRPIIWCQKTKLISEKKTPKKHFNFHCLSSL